MSQANTPNIKRTWIFFQRHSIFSRQNRYVKVTMDNGKLRIRVNDNTLQEEPLEFEMEVNNISECRCISCHPPYQYFLTTCCAVLTYLAWYMLTEYHGWASSTIGTILSMLGLIFFGFGIFHVATGYKRLVLKTQSDTIEAVVLDSLLSSRNGLKSFLGYLQFQNPKCRIDYG